MSKPLEVFMQEAISEARLGLAEGKGGPFGCVIVKGGVVVGKGCNEVLSTNDPTAHAEIVAIRRACHFLQDFQLAGCDVYTTCEPCPMCLGAIYWSRPDRVFYAAGREDAAAAGFDDSFIYHELTLRDEQKKIPMIPFMRDAVMELFSTWACSPLRRPY
jgi:guanine deaminase